LFDPKSFKTQALQRIAAYWLSKVQGDRLPSRSDIHPEDIVPDLPYLYLVDIEHDPLAFRFRLVGTAICLWAGRDYTGVAVNEPDYGAQWQSIFDDYRGVMETKMPTRSERGAPWTSKEYHQYERFLAPLASDGSKVDMIFGALHVIERKR
jgi:hypothetical protein